MDHQKIEIVEQVNIVNNRKKQVYGFVAFTIIVILILSVGAVKPSLETIVRLNKEIKTKEQTLSQLESKIDAVNKLAIQYLDFQETGDDLELIYPTTGDFSLFLANVEAISENTGFELKSINFDDSSFEENNKFKNLKPISVKIAVVGRADNLIPLLKNYEAMPMYPEIQTVAFNKDTDDRGQTIFAISLVIYEIAQENFYD